MRDDGQKENHAYILGGAYEMPVNPDELERCRHLLLQVDDESVRLLFGGFDLYRLHDGVEWETIDKLIENAKTRTI